MYTKRNGNIELLRFIFAIFIVLLHLFDSFDPPLFFPFKFISCYLGVEFFFIITGVFLGKSLSKTKDNVKNETLNQTLSHSRKYILHKIDSIYVFFFISCIIGLVVQIKCQVFFLATFSDFLFLQTLGYPTSSLTGTVWFLSAMFVALFFLYPIVRKYYDIYVKYIAPFIVLFINGFIVHKYGSLNQFEFFGFISLPCLRAISDISLGLLVNEFSKRISKFNNKNSTRLFLTGIEIIGYFIIFFYMCYFEKWSLDSLIVILLAACISITLSEKSIFYGKLDNKLVYFLGKLSMPLFMNHYYWVYYFNKYLIKNHIVSTNKSIIITLILSFATSLIVYFVGNKITKAIQKTCSNKKQF